MNPFAEELKAHKDPPAAMYIPSGSSNRPLSKDWNLADAVVHGYKASGWVYACATILAKHVGRLQWRTFAPNDAGDPEVVPNHDAALLIEYPNQHQTRSFQMQQRTLHLTLGGNALDKIIFIGAERSQRPEELWPLRPDSMRPIPSVSKWLSGWEVTNRSGGQKEILKPEVVSHAMLVDPDNPFWGMSPLRSIGPVVDMDVGQVDWNRNLVDNDMVVSGVYVDPAVHTEPQRKQLKESLIERGSGPGNAGKPLVLSGGAKWLQQGISPKELDWIESRKFTVGEIATAMGLLTSRFISDAQTFANLEAAIRYEIVHGALPLAGVIGDALGQRLLTVEELRNGWRIRPDLTLVPELKKDVHKAAETMERLVGVTVTPQQAAAIVDLQVGELAAGDVVFKKSTLEVFDPNPEIREGDM